MSAVQPVVRWSTRSVRAPLVTSASTAAACPPRLADISAVPPWLSNALGSAPWATSCRMPAASSPAAACSSAVSGGRGRQLVASAIAAKARAPVHVPMESSSRARKIRAAAGEDMTAG